MSLLDLNKIADTLYRRVSTNTPAMTPHQFTPTSQTDGGEWGWYRPFPFTPLLASNRD